MTQSRQHYLDSMRGAAALIVTIVHYFGAFRPYSVFGSKSGSQPQSTWENLCHFPLFSTIFAGHFAVCLFFILSGYVLSIHHFGRDADRVKLFSAMVKRPIRLGGLVLFTVLLSALIQDQHLYFNVAASNISGSQAWLGSFWAESRSGGGVAC
jgi:peptidoglycan/LPS O-acetylase OafA/YrhL